MTARVNLQIRAHITTYYHLQIVTADDHRLRMALLRRRGGWTQSPRVRAEQWMVDKPRYLSSEGSPWLLQFQFTFCDKKKQKRVHHFLVIISSDSCSQRLWWMYGIHAVQFSLVALDSADDEDADVGWANVFISDQWTQKFKFSWWLSVMLELELLFVFAGFGPNLIPSSEQFDS